MQNQNWRFSRVIAVATVTLLVVSFTTLAVAQRIAGEERTAIFASAPKVSTSVKGVSAFAAPPKGFNPLKATNRELLTYGYPQAPDKAEVRAYDHWQRAVLALKTHVSDVRARPYTSREMMPTPNAASASSEVSGVPTQVGSYNWSGIANTNNLKAWNSSCLTPAACSFDEVVSIWNVPVSNHPFGNLPCSEGPWYTVSWNGIDGAKNGDVVQGGSAIYWDDGGCGGPIEYFGWVEWYPSYPILTVYCGSNPCPVGPGDDFEVVTYGANSTTQNVFIEDVTQQWGGTLSLGYVSGPFLVGQSAEWIVERPCCIASGFPLALANYIWDFFDDAFAYNVHGTIFYPGSGAASTRVYTMYADDGATPISYVPGYGTAGFQGRYSLWFSDENCAYSGGCTP